MTWSNITTIRAFNSAVGKMPLDSFSSTNAIDALSAANRLFNPNGVYDLSDLKRLQKQVKFLKLKASPDQVVWNKDKKLKAMISAAVPSKFSTSTIVATQLISAHQTLAKVNSINQFNNYAQDFFE